MPPPPPLSKPVTTGVNCLPEVGIVGQAPPPHSFFAAPPSASLQIPLAGNTAYAQLTSSAAYNQPVCHAPLLPLPPGTGSAGSMRYYGDFRHEINGTNNINGNINNNLNNNNTFGCHGNLNGNEVCTPFIAQPLLSRDIKRPFYINNIMHPNDALQWWISIVIFECHVLWYTYFLRLKLKLIERVINTSFLFNHIRINNDLYITIIYIWIRYSYYTRYVMLDTLRRVID